MCGITALLLYQPNHDQSLVKQLRSSLNKIQHRGYDGAGIAINGYDHDHIHLRKGSGLISEVLTDDFLKQFPESNLGIGHTRYKTVGECTDQSTQPLLNQTKTICLVHNGQIEAEEVPDSGKILNEFEKFIMQMVAESDTSNLSDQQIFVAISHLMKTLKGAYSCFIMINGLGLIAFRDPMGIRPLVYSYNAHGDVILASEDVAIRVLPQFKLSLIKDVKPGECLILRLDGSMKSEILVNSSFYTPCIFEYIYLAHRNSTLNGIDVRLARKKLGILLAEQIKTRFPVVCQSIDWIVPVPETSCIASQELAIHLDLPYLEILKLDPNRKKARTFILPTQEQRIKAVTTKFQLDTDPIALNKLIGSHVLVVDDSIVRGTTLRCVVKMLKSAGVREVSVASLAPPVKYKNVYGIDIPDDSLLIAKDKDVLQIAKELDADRVIYQNLSMMVEEFIELGTDQGINGFECSLFNSVSN